MEQFERNITNFLQGEYALDSPFGQEAGIGNVDDDDYTHVPTAIELDNILMK